MPVSNPLPLTITPKPKPPPEQQALQPAGWEVRVRYGAGWEGDPGFVVTDFVSLTIGPELNGPGAGSITFDEDSPMWQNLLPNGEQAEWLQEYEHLWQAFYDGELRFEWLGESIETHLVEDDESRQITISGPGTAKMLSWALVLPVGFPPAGEAPPIALDDPRKYKYVPRYNIDQPAMQIWLDQLQKAQARGTIPWVHATFTATADSVGQPWQVVQNPTEVADPDTGIQLEVGTNLLDLLNAHTGQDYSKQFAERTEWFMQPGFYLRVQQTIGIHREDHLVFFEGAVETIERSRTRDEIGNFVVTMDENGSTSLALDTTSVARWNQRELLNTQNQNVTDPARRAAVNQVVLEQHNNEKDQWTIAVPADRPGFMPFIDYDIGDWIGISRYNPYGASTVDPFRVMALTVKVEDNVETVELTLQSTLELRQKQLEARLTAILNQITHLQGKPTGTATTAAAGIKTPSPDGDKVVSLEYLVKDLQVRGLSTSKMITASIGSGGKTATVSAGGTYSTSALSLTLEPGRWLVQLDLGFDSDYYFYVRYFVGAGTAYPPNRVVLDTFTHQGVLRDPAVYAMYTAPPAYDHGGVTERMWIQVTTTGVVYPVFSMGSPGDFYLWPGTTLSAIKAA